MKELQSVESSIINAKGFFISMLALMGIGTCLTIVAATKMHAVIIIVIGIFIFWICPTLLFQKHFRKPFTKRVTVMFSDEWFSVEIFTRKNGELERKDENVLNTIRSFKIINSTKDDSAYLKLNFKNGSRLAYTFLGQGGADGTDITSLVVNNFGLYNDRQAERDKISMVPNFFSSKAGSYCIAGLAVLLIAAVVLQLIYKPKTVPYTLFAGIFLFVQIIAQRKRDIRDLSKFRNDAW